MVNDHPGLDIPPLQAQYITPPPKDPSNKRQQCCQVNSTPLIYEYEVENSEDELDRDNQYITEYDDETSYAMIRSLNALNDQTFDDENKSSAI